MTKRGPGPALYEMLQGRSGARQGVAERPMPQSSPPPASMPTGAAWLSPGRMVRVPVGYVLLAIAGTIVLMAIAYMLGFSSGRRVAEGSFDERAAQLPPTQNPGLGAADPLNTDAGSLMPELVERDVRPPAAAKGDPRQPNMNYFVLMHATRPGANKFVDFCREHGLDAYAVPVNNRSTFQVIVLPGYASGAPKPPEIKKLEDRIVETTRKWQALTKESLTYYAALYSGPNRKTGQP